MFNGVCEVHSRDGMQHWRKKANITPLTCRLHLCSKIGAASLLTFASSPLSPASCCCSIAFFLARAPDPMSASVDTEGAGERVCTDDDAGVVGLKEW